MVGVPFRTFQNYEYGQCSPESFVGRSILKALKEYQPYTKSKGVLPFNVIKEKASSVLAGFKVDFAYLFGSYSKGRATEESDIDILVSGAVDGIDFFSLKAKLEKGLYNKDVDLIKLDDVMKNKDMLFEVLKDGIKIYG